MSTKPKRIAIVKHKRRRAGRPPAAERTEDKKMQILMAAVSVFADRGYHGARISDVAEEAGVAYGLVYHYYGNKERLLRTIFETNWSIFADTLESIASTGDSTNAKLQGIIDLIIHSFTAWPEVVTVLVHEFGRSSRLGDALNEPEVNRVFTAVRRIFEDADGIDAKAMTVIFLGALESALVSFVLGRHRDGSAASIDAMRDALYGTFVGED